MHTATLLRSLLRLAPAGALALAIAPGVSFGDVFELASGGRVVGDLLNEKELPRQTYEVKTPLGIIVSLDRTAVKSQEKQRPALEEYAEIKPSFADTVEGQRELADWCRSRHLYAERDKALERVLEIDPNNIEARRILGHVKLEGKWVAPDVAMAARGYVEHKGRWRLPQEIEAMTNRDKRDKAEREWFAKIERWKKSVVEQNSREDFERIRNIDDPLALRALTTKLKSEPLGNRNIRVLYLEAINTIGGPSADQVLGFTSLYDDDVEVRLSSMDYLQKRRPPEVVLMYMKALRHSNADVINRAGHYLGLMNAESAVPSLIDALISAHKFQVTYGAPGGGGGGGMGLSNTFSKGGSGTTGGGYSGLGSGGGMAFSQGSQTVIETHYSRNEAVLNSLVTMTKQNFGYDMAAWKAWYAQQAGPSSLDARRDRQ